ncbi:MAG: hypothetical protein COU82_01680 [Candidatus Portnoybacteria bacterium CG10_big_fil_rev_8_21_14_0_10_38_18]|uniref:Type 4a pilus biogenesis protein PilO n=1 Tax=Candidatus Portnoybacteria bacterium CG10_big_fil_rev_8_21_14_0_10_38_18 TaxID=1974813 RepID=A0A2M8KC34_9BACT|nr:MAG: hypothetical protein COU82_01680 [Candidatus Portnoybacteria bacterium CG10_big_fil_rev_8_21_14_0_10_38_18]
MIKNAIIIILVLVFVAIVVFLDVPGVQNVLTSRKDIEIQKQRFLDTQELEGKIEKLVSSYEGNKDVVEKTTYILPDNEDLPNLIVQLEALAFEQGLLLEKIEFAAVNQDAVGGGEEGSTASTQNYQTITITLKLMGSYPALKNFLKETEENMRLMDVSSINFSTSSGETPEIFEFDLRLNTYYQ